jgi:hypothetical protein
MEKKTAQSNRFAEPGVEVLDCVAGVHDSAQLGGKGEEGDELGPRPAPGVDHGRVTGLPDLGELGEAGLGRLDCTGRSRGTA